jgi:hypothetical protein
MDDKMIFYGRVANNKFVPYRRELLNKYVTSLNGKEVEFSIEVRKDKRTDGQNRLYWLYLRLIVENSDGVVTKDAIDSLHEYLKRQLLKAVDDKIKLPNGKVIEFRRPESTTKLDKATFSKYMKDIEILTGIPVPDKIY